MKDYFIDIKVKNNLLMSRIRNAGFTSIASFSTAAGFTPATIYRALNLKLSVYNKRFKLNDTPVRLANFFLCEPTDLFPEEIWYESLKENKVMIEASGHEIQSLTSRTANIDQLEHLIDVENAVDKMMKSKNSDGDRDLLTPRERTVIQMRFSDSMTLDEVAADVGVTSVRIRQIEMKALRKMRHPTISAEHRELLNNG